MSLTISSTLSGLHRTDIGDIAVVTDGIVIDEITYLLYQTVITYCHIT